MRRIIKKGTNNVEVQTVLYDAEIYGNEVITHIESYGQDRIDSELTSAQDAKDYWDNLNAVQYCHDKEQEQDDKIDDLNDIQEAMDG